MQVPEALYQSLLLASVVTSCAVALRVLADRDHRGAVGLTTLLAGAAVWSLMRLAATAPVPGVSSTVFLRATMVGVSLVPVGTLLFVLAYAGHDSLLDRRSYAALSVEPIAYLALAATNGSHALVWRRIEPDPVEVFEVVYGPIFYAHAVYSYLLLLAATAVAVRFALRSTSLHRRQSWTIVVATLVPTAANAATLAGATAVDYTPVAFAVSGVVLAASIRRDGLLDVAPLARGRVLNTIEEAVFVVDDSGRLLDCNDRALSFIGVDDPVGEPVADLLADRPDVLSFYRSAADATAPLSEEVVVGERLYEVRATPIRDARGDLAARVFLALDLTEQRRREARLERRNRQLGRFASVVSHDLRNPLSVASSSLQLARETGADEHFDRADDALDRTEALVEEMLTLARADDEEMELESVSLGSVAAEAWEYVDTPAATLDVLDDVRLQANRDRLIQLFENLYRNAVEHGGEDVTVTVGALSEGFFVADDGAGFGDADPASLFDANYSTDPDGTGLGLSIVAEIASSHGWSVEPTTVTGGGARFEFRRDPATPIVRSGS